MTTNISFPGMKIKGMFKLAGIFALGISLSACQGQLSDKSPVHPNMNMDQQPRKEALEENNFFADGRSMRQPVEGTVARGYNKTDRAYYAGVDENGDFIDYIPADLTKSFLYRGKDRYEIYCMPCHGKAGAGDGVIMEGNYGYVPAPSYHDARIRGLADGALYSAIYDGVRTMPSYATQIAVEDRWAIVAYIRALQASQNVSEEEMQNYNVDLTAMQQEHLQKQSQRDSLEQAQEAEETPEPTAELGKQLFEEKACSACHSTDGTTLIGPTLQGMYGSVGDVITQEGDTNTVTKDDEYITESIMNPDASKPVGFEDQVMSQLPIETHEIEALIEYIKTLSSNSNNEQQ